MKIANNVFAVMGMTQNHPSGVNAGFVVSGGDIVYIDTGWTIGSAQTIMGYSKAAAPLSVPHTVFFTDKHLDCISGMGVFKETGARLAGHPNLDLLLNADLIRNYHNMIPTLFPENPGESEIAFRDVELYPLDLIIEDEQTMLVGETEFKLIPVSGHSNAGLAIYLPQTKVLFAGDIIASEYEPDTRFGDVQMWMSWLKSLEALEQLDIERIVPGHGRLCGKSEIRRNIDCLTNLISQTDSDR